MAVLPDDFCAFILTHGRADRVFTYDSLRRSGYSGRLYIVIDDEDETAGEYFERFGRENVLVFSKKEVASTFDEADIFNDRRSIVYARNACFSLAKQVGCRHFIQLDDDYTGFYYRFDKDFKYSFKPIKNIDTVWAAMLDYFVSTPFLSIAMTQGGDFIGGNGSTHAKSVTGIRKAMNSFICSTERPFKFIGRINEDVNTYTCVQHRGGAFLSLTQVSLNQKTTQSNEGGMTDLYLDSGTYVKSFYTVMFAPSCTRIVDMGDKHRRIHHQVNWDAAAPKILHEKHRRVK